MANKFFYENLNLVEEIFNPSLDQFNRNYGLKAIPVLITGVMDDWQLTKKWTPEYFRTKTGHFEARACRVNDKTDTKIFTIREYLLYMDNCNDIYPYYLSNCKVHLQNEMKYDYIVPQFFKSCLQVLGDNLPIQFQLSWLYLGAKNTYSGLHLDIYNTSAWNAVISGKKIWLFYPSEQSRFLYNGLVNPFNPDFEKFPNFKKAKPIICFQGAGEIVYTPSGWWHAVYNEEAGISLTENFINSTNYGIVKDTLLHHNKLQELAVVEKCMKHFAS